MTVLHLRGDVVLLCYTANAELWGIDCLVSVSALALKRVGGSAGVPEALRQQGQGQGRGMKA